MAEICYFCGFNIFTQKNLRTFPFIFEMEMNHFIMNIKIFFLIFFYESIRICDSKTFKIIYYSLFDGRRFNVDLWFLEHL